MTNFDDYLNEQLKNDEFKAEYEALEPEFATISTNEIFKPKFSMSIKDNVLWAKRNLIDSIWKSANLEGIAVTYPDTQVICEGMSVAGYSIDEINAVNDLKHAWQYLLDNIEQSVSLDFMKTLHRELGKFTVTNAGSIRWHEVHIGGTEWIPPIPDKNTIIAGLEKINRIKNPMDMALEMFLFCARGQFFYDGNKRLSTLMANKVMIQNGIGILSIPIKYHTDFYKMLIKYYETAQKTELKNFLYKYCIDGITLSK